MKNDPIIAEIHQIRAKLMEEANGDLDQLAKNARLATERLGLKALTPAELKVLHSKSERTTFRSGGETRSAKSA